MHKLELVLLVGDGVDVLGNMIGGLLGRHVEVQIFDATRRNRRAEGIIQKKANHELGV